MLLNETDFLNLIQAGVTIKLWVIVPVRTMSSTSDVVRGVVESNPCILNCLLNDVVSYTKLAKKLTPIVSELIGREVSVDAVKMALIRLARKASSEVGVLRRDVAEILSRTTIEIRTGVTIIVLRNTGFAKIAPSIPMLMQKARFITVMQSPLATTVVLDNETAEEVIARISSEDVIQVQRDLAAIVLVSPPENMYTPGFVSAITSILALNNINILHIESCYTDTVIIVSKEDVMKAFQVISKYIETSKEIMQNRKVAQQ
jgi:hypothetical protein